MGRYSSVGRVLVCGLGGWVWGDTVQLECWPSTQGAFGSVLSTVFLYCPCSSGGGRRIRR